MELTKKCYDPYKWHYHFAIFPTWVSKDKKIWLGWVERCSSYNFIVSLEYWYCSELSKNSREQLTTKVKIKSFFLGVNTPKEGEGGQG